MAALNTLTRKAKTRNDTTKAAMNKIRFIAQFNFCNTLYSF
jgi:hypothetical protein